MTVKRLKDAQVYDVNHMTKEMLFDEGKSKVFILNFMPGQSLPSHGHPHTQVYLLVIEGAGTCHIDEQAYQISHGEVIHCSMEQMLSIENTGTEPMSVYVVLARENKEIEKKKR
jgi:quercetin dioxygenase-like cupin family protein